MSNLISEISVKIIKKLPAESADQINADHIEKSVKICDVISEDQRENRKNALNLSITPTPQILLAAFVLHKYSAR